MVSKMKNLSLLVLVSILFACGSSQMVKATKIKTELKPSGIYGKVLRIGFPPRSPEDIAAGAGPSMGDEFAIPNCVVVVRRAHGGREVKRTKTNRYGCFKITLQPGQYEVEPLNPDPDQPGALEGSKENVTVWRGFYSEARAVFDGGW
jgi:hypothetical protein